MPTESVKQESSLDLSSESDSDDTIILPEDEWCAEATPRTLSFLRFAPRETSVETAAQVSRDCYLTNVHLTSASNAGTNSNSDNFPSGLSFLTAHPSFSSMFNSGQPGSFSFKDCRLLMGRNNPPMLHPVEQTSQSSSEQGGDIYFSNVSSQAYHNTTHTLENIEPNPSVNNISKQYGYIPIMPVPSTAPVELPPSIVPLHTVARNKNREAAKRCRLKKKNYIQRLEQDYKELQKKYAICVQENDDLKRLIFQQLNFTLSHQTTHNSETQIKSNVLIAPAQVTEVSVPKPVPLTQPLHINVISVPTTSTTDQPSFVIKLVPAQPAASTT